MRGILLVMMLLTALFFTGCELASRGHKDPDYLVNVGAENPFASEEHIRMKSGGSYSLRGAIYANHYLNSVYLTGQDGSQALFCFDQQNETSSLVIHSLPYNIEPGQTTTFDARIRDSVGLAPGNYKCVFSASSHQEILFTKTFELEVVEN